MKISLENIAHETRAYMQDGKVIFKPSKEMECIPCSIKDDKTIYTCFVKTDRMTAIPWGGGGGGVQVHDLRIV